MRDKHRGMAMRSSVIRLVVFLLGAPLCSIGHAGDAVFQDGFEPGFQILTPEIVVAPGEEVTWCYYVRTPNSATLGVQRWSSTMRAGMQQLILFGTYDSGWNVSEWQPEGTLTNSACSLGGAGGFAGWMYAAHDLFDSLDIPADDGSGTPLAIEVLPNQPVFVQMHLVNLTDAPLTASALVKAEALVPATPFTKTSTFLADNINISIPAMGTATVPEICPTPASTKFWYLTTRTHKFATEAKISDGASDLVVTTDWEHPASIAYVTPNFHAFATGMSYACSYTNPNNFSIHAGDSEQTDEACMAIGYFFPALHPAICFNHTPLP